MSDRVAKRLYRIGLLMAGAAPLWACSVFFDAATSIADDIETGAKRLERSSDSELTIVHTPKRSRSDCADAYRVQFTRDSLIGVWCYAPDDPTKVVSSHVTTYHLNYVEVPETTIVDKKRGEPLSIELVKTSGKPVVKRVF
jgi:outer membrane lipoprotein-sorting protein